MSFTDEALPVYCDLRALSWNSLNGASSNRRRGLRPPMVFTRIGGQSRLLQLPGSSSVEFVIHRHVLSNATLFGFPDRIVVSPIHESLGSTSE